jgi:[protein-PII] uridylyltransferase
VDEAVRALAEDLGPRMALVAVGGYGRQLMLPGSDVDLMVLHAGRGSGGGAKETAEQLFYPFWDEGLPLGHAVRTVEESLHAARDRVDVACSLLDARHVWGDRALFGRLEEALRALLSRQGDGFVERLRRDAQARHARHAPCSMALEPDLKEGSGGLRDVHAVGWVRQVRGGLLLRDKEAEALGEAEEVLVRLRSALHLETGKRTDRLFLEHQPHLAAAFGFDATEGLGATDALMRSLFEHARQVEHIRDLVFERAGADPGRQLDVPPVATPEEVMAAFAVAARSGAPLSSASLDALEAADLGPSPYEWTASTYRAFVEILAAGDPGSRAMEAMDRAGVLVRFLPQWEPVRCRPQRDPYHRFTVDVHLLQTAAVTARLLEEGSAQDPVLAAAAGAVPDRDAVLLGAFLHDIGKTGQGRHVEVGVREAGAALDRMGVADSTRAHVLFLVSNHLLLSETAVRRDLADENLVLDVSATVGDPGRLAMLYLLTAADAEATGPHARTPWRLALVRELVGKVQHVLESGVMAADRAEILQARTAAVRERLRDEPQRSVLHYLERLPRAYLLSVTPEAAAGHYRLLGPALAAAEVRTAAGSGERPGTYDLTVVAADRPGLLARIAASLALAGLNILSAQAFTTEDGVAIDLFTAEPAYLGDVDEERWRSVRHTLRRALDGRISLDHRVREKRRHYPPPSADVSTEVRVLNDASDFFTVVEVEASDRIGLLFDLARAFEELSLDVHLAKAATYGHRVVDVFYVRDLYGRKADDPEHAREIERVIRWRLDPEDQP